MISSYFKGSDFIIHRKKMIKPLDYLQVKVYYIQ
nr:MAG TPA: hypothetical protein [Bacteriophage sp.]